MGDRVPPRPPRLSIGALSKQTGVNIETIRFYEKAGLVPPPPRSAGGFRLYGRDHVRRLTFVRRARGLGFTLDEVRALLRLADGNGHTCAEAQGVASAHLSDVRAKLRDLRRLEKALADVVARCAEGALPECPLIEALFGEPPRAGTGGVAEGRNGGA
jgi:MerR family mercuric resistance operon transcriptional regulator